MQGFMGQKYDFDSYPIGQKYDFAHIVLTPPYAGAKIRAYKTFCNPQMQNCI